MPSRAVICATPTYPCKSSCTHVYIFHSNGWVQAFLILNEYLLVAILPLLSSVSPLKEFPLFNTGNYYLHRPLHTILT